MDEFLKADDSGVLRPDQASGLKYQGEDDRFYFVTDRDGTRLRLPKNRSVSTTDERAPVNDFAPVFRLLGIAFLGLAPAGLGTLIFAPLAVLGSVIIAIRRPLDRAGRIRMAAAWGIAAGLLVLAIPMSAAFLARLR